MGVFNGLFPVLEGKEDAARSFANEAGGQRRDQLAAHLVRSNVTRETWSLLATPMGSQPDDSTPPEAILDWKA